MLSTFPNAQCYYVLLLSYYGFVIVVLCVVIFQRTVYCCYLLFSVVILFCASSSFYTHSCNAYNDNVQVSAVANLLRLFYIFHVHFNLLILEYIRQGRYHNFGLVFIVLKVLLC